MTRLFRRRLLKTSLLAFATSMILVPAASAMPVLSDPAASAPRATPAFVNLGPYDGYVTRTADNAIRSPIASTPLADSWYTPAVLGISDTSVSGRATPDVPPVAGRAVPVLSSPSGFDWGDAGIALALGAFLTAFVAFGALRSRRARHVPILH
jgi:hypothetical protein